MVTRNIATLILAAAAAGLAPSLANANLITVNIQENAGAITTVAGPSILTIPATVVGDWTVSGSATGTPPEPSGTLISDTVDVQDTGGSSTSTLHVWITETGLTAPIGTSVGFLSSLTTNLLLGNITSTTLSTCVDPTNAISPTTPSTCTPLDSATFMASNETQSAINTASTVSPYSLTEEYTIVASGGGTANLTIDVTPVPEPASLVIFGTALLGLGAAKRRRRKNVV